MYADSEMSLFGRENLRNSAFQRGKKFFIYSFKRNSSAPCRFSPCVINLSRNKNVCCRLKKVVAKSRARVYFEQQILALLLIFHQTYNLSRNKFAHVARQVEGFCICISPSLLSCGSLADSLLQLSFASSSFASITVNIL